MTETVYHYSDIQKWWDIRPPKGFEHVQNTGIQPKWPSNAYGRSAVYCLMNPKPMEWTHNTEFSDEQPWDQLFGFNRNHLLFEIDVDPEEAHVLDWAHMEGHNRRWPGAQVPERFAHRKREDAMAAYRESAVTLSKYTHDAMCYCIPEVVIERPVDDFRISMNQDVLIERLEWQKAGERGNLLRWMERIPDLRDLFEWYRRIEDEAHENRRELVYGITNPVRSWLVAL